MTDGIGEFHAGKRCVLLVQVLSGGGRSQEVEVALSTARADLAVTHDVDLGPGRAHTGLASRR